MLSLVVLRPFYRFEKKKDSVESGYIRQQRLQNLMQIKLQQTRQHLEDDRRQPDEEATSSTPWLLPDIDCFFRPHYVAVSFKILKVTDIFFFIENLKTNVNETMDTMKTHHQRIFLSFLSD